MDSSTDPEKVASYFHLVKTLWSKIAHFQTTMQNPEVPFKFKTRDWLFSKTIPSLTTGQCHITTNTDLTWIWEITSQDTTTSSEAELSLSKMSALIVKFTFGIEICSKIIMRFSRVELYLIQVMVLRILITQRFSSIIQTVLWTNQFPLMRTGYRLPGTTRPPNW